MAKAKRIYVCDDCGAQASQWSGQCADCGAWNALTERVQTQAPSVGGAAQSGRFAGYAGQIADRIHKLADIAPGRQLRRATGNLEWDRVLGGGVVEGSAILVGGDPGIGKSTLLLQVMATLAPQVSALYASGEESLEQIALRAQRLGLQSDGVEVLAQTQIEAILALASTRQSQVLVVDSIQTLHSESMQSAPGSVAQVRESAGQLVRFAKQTGATVMMVGHVTKEGHLAGPRVLEHMVDTVLYFEGDASQRFRILRAVKNRFGAANEIGVFAMTEVGLKSVSNPSAIFLSRHEQPAPGSMAMVTWEGSRPLLVEVQALVDDSPLGNPRRVTVGLEHNRLALLLAVLHRHGGIAMYDQDVYINIVGGVRVTETAADLPVLLSAVSSFRSRALDGAWVSFGEIGLTGEIRPVPNGRERLREAAKHGFTRAIVPADNAPRSGSLGDLEVVPVRRIEDALHSVT